jgi:predicted XRE-type DNA-binding protein
MWTTLIQEIIDSGLTQVQIADLVHTGQSHISSLLRGERRQPNWELGDALIRLHKMRYQGTPPPEPARAEEQEAA